jgi:hypothetical protein
VTFALHVDAELWRGSLKAARDAVDQAVGNADGLVPLIEQQAWGLTPARLGQEATTLGVDTVAVSTIFDARDVAVHFPGTILVTTPWDPRDALAADAWDALEPAVGRRLIRTIACTEALHRLAADTTTTVAVVLQGLTSRNCLGLAEPDLDALLADDTIRIALGDRRLDVRGALLALPAKQPDSPQIVTLGDAVSAPPKASHRVREAWGWSLLWIRALAAVEQAGIDLDTAATTMWVTRLDDAEAADLRNALDVVPLRVVRGCDLWLPETDALRAFGTVLAVHRVERGRDVGDRQRRTGKDGYVVALAGGTAHGIGVGASTSTATLRERAAAAAGSAMEAIGRVRSPFTWAGKRRLFAEPPASGTSLIWLSADDVSEALAAGHRTPTVGDQWQCHLTLDLARFDRVLGLD